MTAHTTKGGFLTKHHVYVVYVSYD